MKSFNSIFDSIESELERADRICNGNFTRMKFHSILQDRLAKLSLAYGCTNVKEYPVEYGDTFGYIDTVWFRDGKPVVAIEIDSSYRKKSVEKLLASDAGIAIWVYYGSIPVPDEVSDRIAVVHYDSRSAAPRSRRCGAEPVAPAFVYDRHHRPECPVSGATGLCSFCIRAGWDLRRVLCPWG